MSIRPSSTWRERLKSPLTWHLAGFAVVLLLVIVLGVRLGLDWAATNGRSIDALAGKQVELKALDLKTAPLRGLDKRVEESRAQIKTFYSKRIPPNYSTIAERVGELEVKSGVRLSRLRGHRPDRDFDGCRHQRFLSRDHAICEQPGARPELFRDPNHGFDRTAGWACKPAAARLHLASAGGCSGKWIAADARPR